MEQQPCSSKSGAQSDPIPSSNGPDPSTLVLSHNLQPTNNHLHRHLFRDFKFATIFLVGVIATFPLLVPPFFIPLYSASLGLSSNVGAGLIAGFNISSAVGRLGAGIAADALGPLNTLFIALLLTTLSMVVVWPVSDSLGPLVLFVATNGCANGGFFATMPTVVGTVFGSQRVPVAMGMVVTGWAGGYLMVIRDSLPLPHAHRVARARWIGC